MILRSWLLAILHSELISQGRPAKCTGMIAFVFGVIFVSTSCGEIFIVIGSISAKTGLAPAWIMALMVAQKVSGVVITSSPGPTPAANMLRCKAAVQEFSD